MTGEVDVVGKPVGVLSAEEPWSEVRLADGAVLRVRSIVTGAAALLNPDGTPALDQEGRPAYVVNFRDIVVVGKTPKKTPLRA